MHCSVISAVTVYVDNSLCSPSLAARKDHAVLLREYVSRKSAGRGRAVLEAVGLDVPSIDMCYADNPRSEEAAVQAGLLKWAESHNATWTVLIGAMENAEIAVWYIDKLKEELQKGVCTHVLTSPPMWSLLTNGVLTLFAVSSHEVCHK